MNELFKANWKVLEYSRPELAESLKADYEKFLGNPHDFSKQNENELKLAQEIINKTNLHHPQLVFVFGFGEGYLFKEFEKQKTKTTSGFFLIEKDVKSFLAALSLHDLTWILQDPESVVAIGSDIDALKRDLVLFFSRHATMNRSLKILADPRALDRDADFYNEISDYFYYARDQSTVWTGNSLQDQLQGFKNTIENINRLVSNNGLATLENKFKGKVAISVAAGPGTNEAWDFLKRVHGKVPIIACDTMVKPMNKHGVIPDIVTALERDPIVADMFRGQPINERTSLVAPSLLLPDSFQEFKGRHIIYGASFSRYLECHFLGLLIPGSSAGNLNLAIADYMGFESVIMIGHNLAFAHGTYQSHVDGTIDPTREHGRSEIEMQKIATGGKVRTADGLSEVYTIFEYNLFRAQMENLVANSKRTKFYNTTAKGAAIRGTEYMSLEDAEKNLINEDFDFFKAFKKIYADPSEEVVDSRRAKVVARLMEFKDRLEGLSKRAQTQIDSLAQFKPELDALSAPNETWSISRLNDCINQALELKIYAVNKEALLGLGFIELLVPAHIAFERSLNEMVGTYKDNFLLKRDFLLKHLHYFRIWMRWIPRLLDLIGPAIDYQKDLITEAQLKIAFQEFEDARNGISVADGNQVSNVEQNSTSL